MPRLPSMTPRKLAAVLVKHGFVLERTKGSHRLYYNPETMRRAVVPFHSKELPRGTLVDILKRAGISMDDIR